MHVDFILAECIHEKGMFDMIRMAYSLCHVLQLFVSYRAAWNADAV